MLILGLISTADYLFALAPRSAYHHHGSLICNNFGISFSFSLSLVLSPPVSRSPRYLTVPGNPLWSAHAIVDILPNPFLSPWFFVAVEQSVSIASIPIVYPALLVSWILDNFPPRRATIIMLRVGSWLYGKKPTNASTQSLDSLAEVKDCM